MLEIPFPICPNEFEIYAERDIVEFVAFFLTTSYIHLSIHANSYNLFSTCSHISFKSTVNLIISLLKTEGTLSTKVHTKIKGN